MLHHPFMRAARRAHMNFACALMLCEVGCASFTAPPLVPNHAPAQHPLEVTLRVSEASFLQVGPDEWIDWPSSGLAATTADAIWESGWVRHAGGVYQARLTLSLRHYQGAGSGLLPLLTAFVIPGTIDHRLELDLTLDDSPADTVTCHRSADTRTWYQPILIVAYPFRSPGYGRMRIYQALALQCLAEVLAAHYARIGSHPNDSVPGSPVPDRRHAAAHSVVRVALPRGDCQPERGSVRFPTWP